MEILVLIHESQPPHSFGTSNKTRIAASHAFQQATTVQQANQATLLSFDAYAPDTSLWLLLSCLLCLSVEEPQQLLQ